jgi:hypothetical protein
MQRGEIVLTSRKKGQEIHHSLSVFTVCSKQLSSMLLQFKEPLNLSWKTLDLKARSCGAEVEVAADCLDL